MNLPMYRTHIVCLVIGLLSALGLSACGFEPIYARRGGDGSAEALRRVEIAVIPDRSGQILRNHLIDMFDPLRTAGGKPYVLHVRLSETPQVLALRRDNVIARGGYSATATYWVADRDGRRLFTASAGFTTDFEIADSERATSIAREAARDRLMQQIAEEIRQHVALQLGSVSDQRT